MISRPWLLVVSYLRLAIQLYVFGYGAETSFSSFTLALNWSPAPKSGKGIFVMWPWPLTDLYFQSWHWQAQAEPTCHCLEVIFSKLTVRVHTETNTHTHVDRTDCSAWTTNLVIAGFHFSLNEWLKVFKKLFGTCKSTRLIRDEIFELGAHPWYTRKLSEWIKPTNKHLGICFAIFQLSPWNKYINKRISHSLRIIKGSSHYVRTCACAREHARIRAHTRVSVVIKLSESNNVRTIRTDLRIRPVHGVNGVNAFSSGHVHIRIHEWLTKKTKKTVERSSSSFSAASWAVVGALYTAFLSGSVWIATACLWLLIAGAK